MKRKIKNWDTKKENATLMMRALFDVLIDKEVVKNYSLSQLMTKEKEKMTAIFNYVTSYFKLDSDSGLRTSLSNKLTHLPGRTKKSKLENSNENKENEQS